MRPDGSVNPGFLAAIASLVGRIAEGLKDVPLAARPIRMFIAGGAAVHLYTGARVSRDVDAVFSHRVVLPPDLSIFYRDPDGTARSLYFDYQYSDSLGLMHENAHEDSAPLELPGVDASLLDVRLLSPVDLAVSKLARFAEVDRGDIEQLARKGLVDAAALRSRAEESLAGYVGDMTRIKGSLDAACRIADAALRTKGEMN